MPFRSGEARRGLTGQIGTYLTITARAILRWPLAVVVSATAAAFIYRRHRTLAAYGVDRRQARRWRSLGVSLEEAQEHQDLGPEFVSRWLAAGFTVAEMDELIRHKIFIDEAVAWRRAGMSVDVASEWGRYRLSPDDVHAWAVHGFRANAAYVCKSAGLTPEEAAMAYETGEHPAFAAARKWQERHVTLHAPAGWVGPYPPRDAPPNALLSWDDDEDGPKVEWWLPPDTFGHEALAGAPLGSVDRATEE